MTVDLESKAFELSNDILQVYINLDFDSKIIQ